MTAIEFENKTANVSGLVEKKKKKRRRDYDDEISDIEGKCITTSDCNKFLSDMFVY